VGALSNLKGVGPAMASAVLAAGCPELAPFMADECLLSMEGTEGIDYTMKEYMKLVKKTQQCVERLNEQGGTWTPHKVEMAVWTHYVARDLKPEIFEEMPQRHEAKEDRFNGNIDNNCDISPAVNGEVREEEEDEKPETKVEEEPVKNGVEVQNEESEDGVTNGEITDDKDVVREPIAEEVPEAVSSLVSSEVPTEASPSSQVCDEVPSNGTDNGIKTDTHKEVPDEKSEDQEESKEVIREVVEPVAVSAATKRPLEDVSDVEAAAPEMKRVREEETEDLDDGVVSPASSSPVPQMSGAEPVVAPVTSSQPIHTGGD